MMTVTLRYLSLMIMFFCIAPCSRADKPIWTKRGVSFLAHCWSDEANRCPSLQIFSPDRRKFLRVTYEHMDLGNGDFEWSARAVLVRSHGRIDEVGLAGLTDDEIEWSQDSKAFLVNGSDAGLGPERVHVYLLTDDPLRPYDVSIEAQEDLVRSIPPCRAKDLDEYPCEGITSDPEGNNIFGVDFTRGSSAVVVLASYVCSSSMGGIMCQSIGYEVDIRSGKILRRMEPKEFKRLWQHNLAWKYEDPGPPEYKATGK
jgi:hypothetical protein